MKTCCIIGHRKIESSEELTFKIKNALENLIANDVTAFIFGSKSQFDTLCLEIVTELKKIYPRLWRINLRGEFEYVSQNYTNYLLESYDETYFCKKAHDAYELSYVIRNREMIDKSDICFFYYNESYVAPQKGYLLKRSGTKLAYDYAIKRHKTIINIFDNK